MHYESGNKANDSNNVSNEVYNSINIDINNIHKVV